MSAGGDVAVELARYDSLVAQELIAELQDEYVIRYGGPDETTVDAREFDPPGGAFMVMRVDALPAGCAGLRKHDAEQVEVKRMFVRRAFRGQGHSRLLLAWVEDEARRLGYRRILLESGLQQPEAMGLYESSGYATIPGFGFYANSPENRCYAKTLVAEG